MFRRRSTTYYYKKPSPFKYHISVQRIKEVLEKERFSILSEIDVKQILKSKLKVDFDEYLILGVCNPAIMLEMLSTDRSLGILLPYNVVVYVQDGNTYIGSVIPAVKMEQAVNSNIRQWTELMDIKLKKAIDNVTKS